MLYRPPKVTYLKLKGHVYDKSEKLLVKLAFDTIVSCM